MFAFHRRKSYGGADMAPVVGFGLIPTYIVYSLSAHYFSDCGTRVSFEPPLPVILGSIPAKKAPPSAGLLPRREMRSAKRLEDILTI